MRKNKSAKGTNEFEPTILNQEAIKGFANQNKARLLISACDIDYLERNFECLEAYKNSTARIPYLILIFQERHLDKRSLNKKISIMSKKLNCKKILLGLFACDALERIKEELGEAAYKHYRSNYIRCARFIMVRKIWTILGVNDRENTINKACTYVMDFDNYVLGDFNHKTKMQYGEKKAIFCWDSSVPQENTIPEIFSYGSKGQSFKKFFIKM